MIYRFYFFIKFVIILYYYGLVIKKTNNVCNGEMLIHINELKYLKTVQCN